MMDQCTFIRKNTEQKTQTRLCVQKATQLKLKGVLDCEDIPVCATPRAQDVFLYESATMHTVASQVLDLVEPTLIIFFKQVTK